MAIPDLPEEVLQKILIHLRVWSRGYFDLAENRLKLNTVLAGTYASKSLARAASATLYRVIDLRLMDEDQCILLLQQLMKAPSLAVLVREIHILKRQPVEVWRPGPYPALDRDFHDEKPVSKHVKSAIREMGFSEYWERRVLALLKHNVFLPTAALLLRPCVKLEVFQADNLALMVSNSLLASTIGDPQHFIGVGDRYTEDTEATPGTRLALPHLQEIIIAQAEGRPAANLRQFLHSVQRPNLITLRGALEYDTRRLTALGTTSPMSLRHLFVQDIEANGLSAILVACPELKTFCCYWPSDSGPRDFRNIVMAVQKNGTGLRKLVLSVGPSRTAGQYCWGSRVGKLLAETSLKTLVLPVAVAFLPTSAGNAS